MVALVDICLEAWGVVSFRRSRPELKGAAESKATACDA